MTLCCQGVYRLGNCPCAVDTLTAQGRYTGIQTVSKSAESATTSLRLDSDNLQCGFLCHPENTKAGDFFGRFDPDDGTLTCSCCKDPRDPAPQAQIWFSNVDPQKVYYVLCSNIVMCPVLFSM